MKTLLLLIVEFFKTGLFSIGGGLATLPFLYQIGARYGWYSAEDVANMLAVSESTPGPIGVNMATYVGITTAGPVGGLLSTLALVAPSIMIILLVASVMKHFRENRFVQSSLRVIRPVSVGLVAAAVLTVFQASIFDAQALFAGHFSEVTTVGTLVTFLALLGVRLKWKKLHPIVLVLAGAAAGLLLKL